MGGIQLDVVRDMKREANRELRDKTSESLNLAMDSSEVAADDLSSQIDEWTVEDLLAMGRGRQRRASR